jgi:predicted metalloprotease with PDZ domain
MRYTLTFDDFELVWRFLRVRNMAPIFFILVLFVVACANPERAQEDALVGQPKSDVQRSPSSNSGALWYRLEVNDTHLEVHVRLYQPPDATRFFLPTSWGGRNDFASRISIAGARGPEGVRFMTIDRNEGRVEIASEGLPWVELHYRVDLRAPTSSLHVSLQDGILSAYGPAFLVLPAQQILDRSRDIHVEFHTPANWEAISTWPEVEDRVTESLPSQRVRTFVAADGQGLRDAFLSSGAPLQAMQISPTIGMGFGPDLLGNHKVLADSIRRAVESYRRTYGDLGHVEVLVRTSAEAEKGSIGGLGRRGGFVLELPKTPATDPATELLIWHEALHLWNGHRVVPQPDDENRTRWFKEGITHYLALVNACHSRAIDERFVFEELARVADAYERNPARREGRGNDSDLARLPYDLGVLLGLAFDVATPKQQGNVSRWLERLLSTSRVGDFYNERDLMDALNDVTKSPAVRGIWAQNVAQRHVVDSRQVLAAAGLHFLRGSDATPRVVAIDGETTYKSIFGECGVQNAQ